MKVIIAGGRNFDDMNVLQEAIRRWNVVRGFKITEVVSGGAQGADKLGEHWAKANNIKVKIFTADWQTHGKYAGPFRNELMANYADGLIAFDTGGPGTKDMLKKARSHGLRTLIYRVGWYFRSTEGRYVKTQRLAYRNIKYAPGHAPGHE